MISRKEAKKGPGFQVQYEMEPGQIISQTFFTQDACDAFAEALPMTGAKKINTIWKHPISGHWITK